MRRRPPQPTCSALLLAMSLAAGLAFGCSPTEAPRLADRPATPRTASPLVPDRATTDGTKTARASETPTPPGFAPKVEVAEVGPRWALQKIGPLLTRERHDGPRERWDEARERWETEPRVGGLPSRDAVEASPGRWIAAVSEPAVHLMAGDGATWRPMTAPPMVDLQPWVRGTVIGEAGNGYARMARYFAVVGKADGVYVPEPSRQAPERTGCPYRLDIHGYRAAPTGDLLLWGTSCRQASNPSLDYHVERFTPDGKRRELAVTAPEPGFFDPSHGGSPPVLATSPDDFWTIAIGAESSTWWLAHFDGTAFGWEKLPFTGGDSTFGASIARDALGALWLHYVDARYGSGRRGAHLLRRSTSGEWTEVALPAVQHEGRTLRAHYARLVASPRRLWIEVTSWERDGAGTPEPPRGAVLYLETR